MRWPLAVLLAGSLATGVHGATHVVNPEGTGDFPTIQAAIDAAEAGDVVELTDGVFTGDGNRDLDPGGKAITVRSQGGVAAACVLDCEGSSEDRHRAFHIRCGEGPGTVIRDLTVRGAWHDSLGAGMWIDGASPTVGGCLFTANIGHRGGAIGMTGSAEPEVRDCRFVENRADAGGALCLREASAPLLVDCTFHANRANFEAAAICCYDESAPTVTDCLFLENVATYRAGGILTFDDSGPVLVTGSTFMGDSTRNGAGAYCCGGSVATFRACTFHREEAAGFGAGLYASCSGHAVMERCLVTGSVDGNGVDMINEAAITLTCCNIHGNLEGDWVESIAVQYGQVGNFSADPLYCDPNRTQLDLDHHSPCLPGRHPDGFDCGVIGAWPVGCPSVGVEEGRWTHRFHCAPNPFSGRCDLVFSAPRAASLSIIDVAGRRIRHLTKSLSGAGQHRLVWDGTDDAGRLVAPGFYYGCLQWGDERAVRPLVLIR